MSFICGQSTLLLFKIVMSFVTFSTGNSDDKGVVMKPEDKLKEFISQRIAQVGFR